MNITLKGNYQSREVWLNGELLDPLPSQKVHCHSPDGFNWSYGGSGPAQLALAVCMKLFGEEKALQVYQDFKAEVIAALPQKDFSATIDMDTFTINKVE